MITPDGPLGFEVSALYPDHDTRLIGDFNTLVEAEEFADSMRQIDGGRSYSMGPEQSDSARPACPPAKILTYRSTQPHVLGRRHKFWTGHRHDQTDATRAEKKTALRSGAR
jgi:hypothetical protein